MRDPSVPVAALPRTVVSHEGTRLVLRDGSAAGLRFATPDDRETMRRFFQELSPQSRRLRFMGVAEPASALIDRFCDSSDPKRAVTLIAYRRSADTTHFIGVASYFATKPPTAEVAFAVDDRFHGLGIATLLLERLAEIAAPLGFRWFEASTLLENEHMLDVFRDSGFEIRSKTASGCVDVRLSIAPSARSAAAADERDRSATVVSLRPLLQPRSIAVIGASREQASSGRRVLDALVASGFPGSIYPVNPNAAELQGLRCYPSALDLPTDIELAVVAVPRESVLQVVDQCAARKVKAIVLITAGFAETGTDGRLLQAQLVEKVRGHGMRLVGPNCMGVLNTAARMNASFSERMPPAGHIALASQSGGLGLAILNLAAERHIGLSTFVSLGNKADISGNDLLQYGESDPNTSVILLYLESFGNPRRFARLARRISRTKPIVAIKAGHTRAGGRAAGSHTAGLASNDLAVDALFRQSGVIRTETVDEMFDVATCLEAQPLPPGRRVAIVTNTGGPGVLAADACDAAGLTVCELPEATRSQLAAVLPSIGSVGNPIDMVASAGAREYRACIETVLLASAVDAVIVIYTEIDSRQSAGILAGIREGVAASRRPGATQKPVLAAISASAVPLPFQTGSETIPVYPFPERAVRALGRAAAYAAWRAQPPGLFWSFDDIDAPAVDEARTVCRRAVEARGDTWLKSEELIPVLNAFGLSPVPGTLAQTADEALAAANARGFPVALKVASRQVLHKTDVGGVRLNLRDEEDVRAAFGEMSRSLRDQGITDIDGLLVQPMIAGVAETMIGLTADPLFGPLVAFGTGGVHVEVFRDVAFRITPLTDRDADHLLRSIRGFPLLQGYRGHPPADIDALRDVILRVSRLGQEIPEILELDLNPVIALPPGQGCRIVDARARVGQTQQVRT